MKKHRKTPIIVFAIFVLLLTTLSGCKEQDKSYGQDVMLEAVKVRFDRQNTVYYELAQQVEEYISEDRTVAEAEFRSFCLGVNCFIRDESRVDWDNLYQDDVSKAITDIMSMTAKTEMETLRLSSLSETELERLMTNFYDLSDCCDRSKEHSFAYYVAAQECDSDSYQKEQSRVKELLEQVSSIIRNGRLSQNRK